MPKIEKWDCLPAGVREHLVKRMHDRSVSVADLYKLKQWIESEPEVPETEWFKDFGSFKICGSGALPKTFLRRDQLAKGEPL